jgi:hypothetical protein
MKSTNPVDALMNSNSVAALAESTILNQSDPAGFLLMVVSVYDMFFPFYK